MDGILTAKQEMVLRAIKSCYLKNGYAPSLSELQKKLGINTKRGVVNHLIALEKKGFILRTGEPRGIHMVEEDDQIVYDYLIGVPIFGYANAGIPLVAAEEDNLGVLKIDEKLLSKKDGLFSLIVKGDSMDLATLEGNYLKDGSYLVVQKDATIENGDIVVAIIDGCATVKRIKENHDMVVLYPESSNPNNMPIYLDRNSESIINGKVIKVLDNPII